MSTEMWIRQRCVRAVRSDGFRRRSTLVWNVIMSRKAIRTLRINTCDQDESWWSDPWTVFSWCISLLLGCKCVLTAHPSVNVMMCERLAGPERVSGRGSEPLIKFQWFVSRESVCADVCPRLSVFLWGDDGSSLENIKQTLCLWKIHWILLSQIIFIFGTLYKWIWRTNTAIILMLIRKHKKSHLLRQDTLQWMYEMTVKDQCYCTVVLMYVCTRVSERVGNSAWSRRVGSNGEIVMEKLFFLKCRTVGEMERHKAEEHLIIAAWKCMTYQTRLHCQRKTLQTRWALSSESHSSELLINSLWELNYIRSNLHRHTLEPAAGELMLMWGRTS